MRNRKAPRLAYAGRLGDRLKAIELVPLGVFHNITRQRTLERASDQTSYPPYPRPERPFGWSCALLTRGAQYAHLQAVGPSVLAVGGLLLTTCHRRGRHDAEASYVQRNGGCWSVARVIRSGVPRPGGAVGRHNRQSLGEGGRIPEWRDSIDRGGR